MPFRGPISSAMNPQLKQLRALSRHGQPDEGKFVLEGSRLVQAAMNAHCQLEQVYAAESFIDKHPDVVASWHHAGLELWQVDDKVFCTLGETITPQGVIALAIRPMASMDTVRNTKRLLLLDNLRDPGNLGTILRTAQATAVQSVLLSPGCVDAFAPKVVRAGMGAHFGLNILKADWDVLSDCCQEKNCLLADSHGAVLYWDVNWSDPIVLVISNEASGPSAQARALAGSTVRLPMAEGAESLNAAVAAGVLMYEMFKCNSLRRSIL